MTPQDQSPMPPSAPAAPPLAVPEVNTGGMQKRQQHLEGRLADLQDQQTQLTQQHAERDAAEARQEFAANEQDQKDLQGIRDAYTKNTPDLPKWQPKPLVNGADFQQFSLAMVAIALLGGLKGRDAWQTASASLNGAMEGYIEGNQQKSEREWQAFQQDYDRALALSKKAQRDMEDALNAKNNSMAMRLRQAELQARIHEREDIAQAAGVQRSINETERQLQASAESLQKAEIAKARFEIQMETAQAHLAASRHQGELTNEAKMVAAAVENITGKPDFTTQLYRRFGAQQATDIFNYRVYDWMKRHPDQPVTNMANEMVQNNTLYKGLANSVRVNTNRETGVLRLTRTIQALEPQVIELAKKVVPTGTPWLNATVNDVKQKFGDPGIVALKNYTIQVARLYIEAVTMPGSNAQLHATSALTGDEMLNANMTVGQLLAAFHTMNAEINATQGALSSITHDLLDRLVPPEYRQPQYGPGPGGEMVQTDGLDPNVLQRMQDTSAPREVNW